MFALGEHSSSMRPIRVSKAKGCGTATNPIPFEIDAQSRVNTGAAIRGVIERVSALAELARAPTPHGAIDLCRA